MLEGEIVTGSRNLQGEITLIRFKIVLWLTAKPFYFNQNGAFMIWL
jgi:hypothetical protein